MTRALVVGQAGRVGSASCSGAPAEQSHWCVEQAWIQSHAESAHQFDSWMGACELGTRARAPHLADVVVSGGTRVGVVAVRAVCGPSDVQCPVAQVRIRQAALVVGKRVGGVCSTAVVGRVGLQSLQEVPAKVPYWRGGGGAHVSSNGACCNLFAALGHAPSLWLNVAQAGKPTIRVGVTCDACASICTSQPVVDGARLVEANPVSGQHAGLAEVCLNLQAR
jgi:hypothetical protein